MPCEFRDRMAEEQVRTEVCKVQTREENIHVAMMGLYAWGTLVPRTKKKPAKTVDSPQANVVFVNV